MKKFFLNWKVITTIAIVVLLILIWMIGGWLEYSEQGRWLLIITILLIVVTILLVSKAVQMRAAWLFNKMFNKQQDEALNNAKLELKKDVAMLQQRMLSAITTLKKSKLGNLGPNTILYDLPWYMIIGHPSAGKSSAVKYSGLTFPFTDQIAIQGIGGTRNCDWFFSTEGILLDTAGRYVTGEKDRGEWLGFLNLLKKYRRESPINGIILAVSLPDLLNYNTSEFEAYARKMRERVHEITHAFDMRVPIYVVCTKMDLLAGFTEFFSNSAIEIKNQVWGATFEVQDDTQPNLVENVADEFDHLISGLQSLGRQQLFHSGAELIENFTFPIEFSNIKAGMMRFIEILTEKDPYHYQPLIRGFYFTSALQTGQALGYSAYKIIQKFNLNGTLDSSQAELSPKSDKNSFFLRNLFSSVIFPDKNFILNFSTKRRANKVRKLVFTACFSVLLFIIASFSWSFIGNQKLIQATYEDIVFLQNSLVSDGLYERLQALERVQNRILQLEDYAANGAPLQLSFGMYSGDALLPHVKNEYFIATKHLLLLPVAYEIEQVLKNSLAPAPKPEVIVPKPARKRRGLPTIPLAMNNHFWGNYSFTKWDTTAPPTFMKMNQDFVVVPRKPGVRVRKETVTVPEPPKNEVHTDVTYNALKTYLMLSDRERLQSDHLMDQLPRYWKNWLLNNKGNATDAQMLESAERIITFFVQHLDDEALITIDSNIELVASIRDYLKSVMNQKSSIEIVFDDIRKRASTKYPPMTLSRIVGTANNDVLAASSFVEGAFTRDAWDGFILKEIEAAAKGSFKGDEWVLNAQILGEQFSKQADEQNKQELLRMYKAEYIRQWILFTEGVVVREFVTPENAAMIMTKLADKQKSPIKLLFEKILHETSWDKPSNSLQSIENVRSSISDSAATLFGGTTAPELDAVTLNSDLLNSEVAKNFQDLETILASENSLLEVYLDKLVALKVRLLAVMAANERGVYAKDFIQSTMKGTSELSQVLQFVDYELLGSASAEGRRVLRPILLRPLIESFTSLKLSVTSEINKEWNSQVLPIWHSLAQQYPFTENGRYMSLTELGKLLDKNNGVLSRFIDQQLGGFVQKTDNRIEPLSWGGVDFAFDPHFIQQINLLLKLSNSALGQVDVVSRFEVKPYPSPEVSEWTLTIDGQVLHYRNGPQIWQSFIWPKKEVEGGVHLNVVTFDEASSTIVNYKGPLGWMRFMADAKIIENPDNTQTLQFSYQSEGGKKIDFRIGLRVVEGIEPLSLQALKNFKMPLSVFR